MPLAKLQFRPGVNKENTSYSNEGGWSDSDKIRFRFGFPEKIGGWTRQSDYSFLAPCRSPLHSYVTLQGSLLMAVGTRYKFYINEGGVLLRHYPYPGYHCRGRRYVWRDQRIIYY
jgi:hypothetical protein